MALNSSIAFFNVLFGVSIALFLQTRLFAFSYDTDDIFLRDFASTNTYSPLEGAYSYGALGFSFGLGLTPAPFTGQQKATLSDISGDWSRLKDGPLVSAYLTKGFNLPVNFGVVASQIPGTSFEKVGAHLQWSVYEGFKHPSFALRATFNQMNIPNLISLRTGGVGAVVDYSFWSFSTLYASYTINLHHGTYKVTSNNTSSAALRMAIENQSSVWYQQAYHYGLIIRILPPIFSAVIEWQHNNENDQILAKLAFGI